MLYAAFVSQTSSVLEAAGMFCHPEDAGVGPNLLLTVGSAGTLYVPPAEAQMAASQMTEAIQLLTSEGSLVPQHKAAL